MHLMIGELRASVPETVPTDIDASSLNVMRLMLPGSSAGRRTYSGPLGDVSHQFRMPLTLKKFGFSNRAHALPANWTSGSTYNLNGELVRLRVPAYAGCPLSVKVGVFIKGPPESVNGTIGHTKTKMVLAWDEYEPGFGGTRDTAKNVFLEPIALWQTSTANAGHDADKYKSWTRTVVIVPDADGVLSLRLYGMVSGGKAAHDAILVVS